LVDADPGSNPANWQWVAGSGADAAPYFRVFNPILQGEKFDPDGAYVRRWVPELAAVPAAMDPPALARGRPLELRGCGRAAWQDLSRKPIVDHRAARERAPRRLCQGSRGEFTSHPLYTICESQLSLSFRQTLGDNMDDEKPVEPMMDAPSPVMEPPKAPAKKPAKAREGRQESRQEGDAQEGQEGQEGWQESRGEKVGQEGRQEIRQEGYQEAAKKKKKAKKSKR